MMRKVILEESKTSKEESNEGLETTRLARKIYQAGLE